MAGPFAAQAMFTREKLCSLPLELFHMICSELSRHDLTQLLRVCRALFNMTCPIVWRKAELDLPRLLRMMPGCHSVADDFRWLEITVPADATDDYFNRVGLYTPYVETLKIRDECNITGNFLDEPIRSNILPAGSSRALLSRLTSLEVAIPTTNHPNIYHAYRFWLELFTSNLESLKKFDFIANDCDGDVELLGYLLSRCPRLTQLRVNLTKSSAITVSAALCRATVDQSLHYLYFVPSSMEQLDDLLAAASRISSMDTLSLKLGDWAESPSIRDYSFMTNKWLADGFEDLTFLSISAPDDGWWMLPKLCQTPLVTYLDHIKLKIRGNTRAGMSNAIDSLVPLIKENSPIYYLIIQNERESDSPKPTPFPLELLSKLGAFPIRKLEISRTVTPHSGCTEFENISALWPNLTRLRLRSVVRLKDLLNVATHLPKVRYLSARIWGLNESEDPLENALADYLKPKKFPPNPELQVLSLNFTFSHRPSGSTLGGESYSQADLDVLARILVVQWSTIAVHGSLALDKKAYLKQRISHYMRRDGI